MAVIDLKNKTIGQNHCLFLYIFLKPIWTTVDQFGPIWTSLDQFGLIWTHLDPVGAIWRYLELFGAMLSYFEQCEVL